MNIEFNGNDPINVTYCYEISISYDFRLQIG